jgi:hypothetical protein
VRPCNCVSWVGGHDKRDAASVLDQVGRFSVGGHEGRERGGRLRRTASASVAAPHVASPFVSSSRAESAVSGAATAEVVELRSRAFRPVQAQQSPHPALSVCSRAATPWEVEHAHRIGVGSVAGLDRHSDGHAGRRESDQHVGSGQASLRRDTQFHVVDDGVVNCGCQCAQLGVAQRGAETEGRREGLHRQQRGAHGLQRIGWGWRPVDVLCGESGGVPWLRGRVCASVAFARTVAEGIHRAGDEDDEGDFVRVRRRCGGRQRRRRDRREG